MKKSILDLYFRNLKSIIRVLLAFDRIKYEFLFGVFFAEKARLLEI